MALAPAGGTPQDDPPPSVPKKGQHEGGEPREHPDPSQEALHGDTRSIESNRNVTLSSLLEEDGGEPEQQQEARHVG